MQITGAAAPESRLRRADVFKLIGALFCVFLAVASIFGPRPPDEATVDSRMRNHLSAMMDQSKCGAAEDWLAGCRQGTHTAAECSVASETASACLLALDDFV
jgi:hypothetical protein